MEEIKTFEDACKVKGYDAGKVLPDVSSFPEPHRKALISVAKLFIINEAMNYVDNGNKDWKPDWTDAEDYKYYPWFDLEKDSNNPSGFRLGVVLFGYAPGSAVGSRLVYRTRALAKYAATQFEDLYRDIKVLN